MVARTISSASTSGPKPNKAPSRKRSSCSRFEFRLVGGGGGVAFKQHGLALVAGAAIEPVNGHAFGGGLQQQAVVVRLALLRLGAQLHLRAVAGDLHDLLDRQVMAGEGDGLVGGRGVDR